MAENLSQRLLLWLVLEVAFPPPTICSIVNFMSEILSVFHLFPPANHLLKVQIILYIFYILAEFVILSLDQKMLYMHGLGLVYDYE